VVLHLSVDINVIFFAIRPSLVLALGSYCQLLWRFRQGAEGAELGTSCPGTSVVILGVLMLLFVFLETAGAHADEETALLHVAGAIAGSVLFSADTS